jgi:hypothetical protein
MSMHHHHSGGHSHGSHSLGSHLPDGVRLLGSIAIVCICLPPIVQGVTTGNPFGVVLWVTIADLLSKFVWSWS